MGKYDINALLGELEKSEASAGTGTDNGFQNDFWKPTIEKGEERVEYTIRFLPNPDSEGFTPWVERAAHMFNFPNNKFIYAPCAKKATQNQEEKKPCYICEEVSRLYETQDPAKTSIGAKRFAKKRFFHNVLIVKDPRENGKNEGRVMIYEAGSQIFDKCLEFIHNKDLDASERIYFHPTKGTDFKLVITWKSEYQNYEKSDFSRRSSPIEVKGEVLTEEEAETFINENAIKLNERLLGEKVFKSYDDLKDIYLNQGVASDKPKTKKVEKPDVEDEGEEVGTDIDETINDDKVEARNPTEKVEPTTSKKSKEPEEDVDYSGDDDDTDEDAELAALLAD